MCLVQNTLTGVHRYNWDGDIIIHDTVVPSARPIVGVKPYTEYEIDIREYLITDKNAAVQKFLYGNVKQHLEASPIGDWTFFSSKDDGSFDYRAFMLNNFISSNISYSRRGVGKPWLFPDETLNIGYGDCEDIAFLQASLMVASGISSYNIRIALGKIFIVHDDNTRRVVDHAWVVYKNEAGTWRIIEPLLHKKTILTNEVTPEEAVAEAASSTAKKVASMEYMPFFLFNDTHLWRDRNSPHDLLQKYLGLRSKDRLNPTFAGEAHQTIIHTAFDSLPPSFDWFKQYMSSQFLFGVTIPLLNVKIPTVDKKDFNYSDFKIFPYPHLAYNPLDHMDNGYISESWQQVNQNLQAFKANPAKNVDNFAKAAHAIADFYAHTSYSVFADRKQVGGKDYLQPYVDTFPVDKVDYSAGSKFDLTANYFSDNANLWKGGSRNNIPPIWKNKLISGRYSQASDSHGMIESISQTTKPLPGESDVSFSNRGSLPHHNEMAVDGDNPCVKKPDGSLSGNVLFQDPNVYKAELQIRENTAITHIQKAFYDNYTGDKTGLTTWWNNVPKF